MVYKIKFANEISQIFTSKKNINLIFFNILGLQVLRYLLAKITFLFSKFFFQDSKPLGTYENKGVYLIENFLPEKDFLKFKRNFLKFLTMKKELEIHTKIPQIEKTLQLTIIYTSLKIIFLTVTIIQIYTKF